MTTSTANSFVNAPDGTLSNDVQPPASDGAVIPHNADRLLRNSQLKNWDSSSVDIRLAAISCIDIYRKLVIQNTPVELTPTHAESGSEIASVNSGTLVAKHNAGKLALRCRKVSMETDGNSDVRYRLYLAAGFAVSAAVDGETTRVPILLVPVKIERLRGRGSPYTIKHTGEPLRLNPHIAESCNTHVDQLIKPFETDADLRSYLKSMGRKLHGKLQCRVSANTGLFTLQEGVLDDISDADQTDIELERSRPGVEFKPLPPIPDNFNAQLATRILRYIEPAELNTALQTFAGSKPAETATLDYELPLDGPQRDKVAKCAKWLFELGLGHWQLQNLKALPARIQRMGDNIQNICSHPAFARYFYDENQNVGMLLNLYRARNKINNAPPEMQHHAISLHADPETRLLLQKAKIQAATIEQEMQVLHDTFHMSAVPGSAALHKLIKVIAKREQSSQLTNPQYFRARRQLNEILKTHNGLITESDLKRLESMAKTLRFAELFEDDAYYKRCFGSLFHGVSTNWQRLDSVINYTRSLAYDLDSSELVGRLTEHWPSFQRDFASLQDLLRPAATDTHQLRALIPLFIDNTTPLQKAVRTATKFNEKVNTWQQYLNKHVHDGELTPYQIANNQPDTQIESSQDIALPQREYDERIYQHIVGVGLSDDSVAATAEWLTNTLNHLDIDAPTVRRYLDGESQFETTESIKAI